MSKTKAPKTPAQQRRSLNWAILTSVVLFVIAYSQLQRGESFWATISILVVLSSASRAYKLWKALNA